LHQCGFGIDKVSQKHIIFYTDRLPYILNELVLKGKTDQTILGYLNKAGVEWRYDNLGIYTCNLFKNEFSGFTL